MPGDPGLLAPGRGRARCAGLIGHQGRTRDPPAAEPTVPQRHAAELVRGPAPPLPSVGRPQGRRRRHAQDPAPVAPQRTHPHRLDRPPRLPGAGEPPPPGGLSHPFPAGGGGQGARMALRIHEGFDPQGTIPVPGLDLVGQPGERPPQTREPRFRQRTDGRIRNRPRPSTAGFRCCDRTVSSHPIHRSREARRKASAAKPKDAVLRPDPIPQLGAHLHRRPARMLPEPQIVPGPPPRSPAPGAGRAAHPLLRERTPDGTRTAVPSRRGAPPPLPARGASKRTFRVRSRAFRAARQLRSRQRPRASVRGNF